MVAGAVGDLLGVAVAIMLDPSEESNVASGGATRMDVPWRWLIASREVVVVAALTGLATVLRLYRLSEIPFGLRGDEGIVALEAHRILDHGWIGPYVTISAGFPAGAIYLIAPFLWLFGDTVFAVRFGMALLGILTVPIAYIAFRQGASWRIASMSSLLLAVSDWHVHLSRVAYLVIAWPFMEVIAVAFLLAGMRTSRWYYYAAAGVAVGFSWYTYNSALLFWAVVATFLAFRFVLYRRLDHPREMMLYGILAGCVLLAAWPMINYARDPRNDFWSHHEAVSYKRTADWKAAGTPLEKVAFFGDKTADYFQAIGWESIPDVADGLGTTPPIDGATAALAVIGVFIALWRWRQPLYAMSLIAIPVMALGSILTFYGIYRRTFGAVPFIMLLAGTTLGLFWERADALPPFRRAAALTGIALLAGIIVFHNIDAYFGTFQDSKLARTTYFPEMTFLSEKLSTYPDDTYLYFMSLRAQRGNEIRRFLASNLSDTNGADRSREFGKYSLTIDKSPPLAFAFMDAYLEDLPRVMARYPGGQVSEKRDKYGLLYRTYYFPPGSRIKGDGITISPTTMLQPLPASMTLPEGDPPPTVPSCVSADKRPTKFTYYRYNPTVDSYAVFRKQQATVAGDLMVVWQRAPNGLNEARCIATGTLALPNLAADMPEVGFTATGTAIYYIGVASSGDVEPALAPLTLWEQGRH